MATSTGLPSPDVPCSTVPTRPRDASGQATSRPFRSCTAFTLPTSGIDWRTVRGMTWVAGKLVYGSTNGSLRTVDFDPAAATAVDGSTATVVATGTAAATWNNPTLFFATS